MMPLIMDFVPSVVKLGHEITWSDVPDWININYISGGGAASAHVHELFGSNYLDTGIKKASYAQVRYCVTGPDGHVRLMSWSNGPSGQEINTDYGGVHATGAAPQNLVSDITAVFNPTMLQTRHHQFIPQVKGTGKLFLARMMIEWRFPAALATQFV